LGRSLWVKKYWEANLEGRTFEKRPLKKKVFGGKMQGEYAFGE
jgi:hypothetical protein